MRKGGPRVLAALNLARARLVNFQPVANARFRDEIAGARRVLFELAAQLGHVHSKRRALMTGTWSPNLSQQLILREDHSGVLRERREKLVLDRSKVDFVASYDDEPSCEIDA